MAAKTPTRAAPEWQRSNGTYVAGRSYIDGPDALAVELEEKWGRGRLRLLVSPELREKFDRQRFRFNAAVGGGDLEAVRVESDRMGKAWRALDRAATEAGALPADPRCIETVMPDGSVLMIVPDDWCGELPTGDVARRVQIVLAREVAALMADKALAAVMKVKAAFPGAEVVEVRSKGDPLDAFHTVADLDAPFREDDLSDLFVGA